MPLMPFSSQELAWLDSQRLLPLTYWLYQQIDQSSSLNHAELEGLALAYWQQQKRQLQLMALLSKLQPSLKHQPILIKGAQTNISLWQSLGVRSISDYDLLIHQEDLPSLKAHSHQLQLIWEEEYQPDCAPQAVMTACLRKKDLLIECHLDFMPHYLPKLDYQKIHHQPLAIEQPELKNCFIPTAIDQWLIYVANQAKNGFYAFDLLDILEGLLLINQLIACQITPLACDQRIKTFALQPSAFLVLSQLLVFLAHIKDYHSQAFQGGASQQIILLNTDLSSNSPCLFMELASAFDQQIQWIEALMHLNGRLLFKPKFHCLSILLARQLYQRKFLISTRLFKFLIWEIAFQLRMLNSLLKAFKKHLTSILIIH